MLGHNKNCEIFSRLMSSGEVLFGSEIGCMSLAPTKPSMSYDHCKMIISIHGLIL